MSSPTTPDAPAWTDWENSWLAPYAMRTADGCGRRHPEPPHSFRTPYQRDRDRVIHSTAFRRLVGKTQVLVVGVNDHHRTRLTHTLEVTQIARTIARRLCLNEDLTEAIALSHDLGHPPFGHAGEAALDECLRDCGGFDHNLHALRRVELLEDKYPDFPGLNLTWEVREAMARHSNRPQRPEVQPYLDGGQAVLEAQVVDAADSLAYNAHDVDDAIGAGLIAPEDLAGVEFWRRAVERARDRHAHTPSAESPVAVVRELIDWQVTDLLRHTEDALARARPRSPADVRRAPGLLVDFGPEVRLLRDGLERFLHQRVYRHYRVLRMATKGQRILKAMFDEFVRAPGQMPERQARRLAAGRDPLERVVGDYLAGMTDRYAQQEYLRLFQPSAEV